MPTDQLQASPPPSSETIISKPVEVASTGSNPEGRRKTLVFAVIVGALILIGAIAFFLYSSRYESTDDAQVDGHLNGITSRIDGDVKAVYVEENQSVQAGQLLVDLDPRDFAVALEMAQAQLSKAQANARAENPNLPITLSTSETGISTSQSEVANSMAAIAAAEGEQAAGVIRRWWTRTKSHVPITTQWSQRRKRSPLPSIPRVLQRIPRRKSWTSATRSWTWPRAVLRK
jgi:membrane fusion protein (multidrug efflux system)